MVATKVGYYGRRLLGRKETVCRMGKVVWFKALGLIVRRVRERVDVNKSELNEQRVCV